MWKLKNKGFTIIETICALAVFSVLFYSAMYLEINTLRLKRQNKEIDSYIQILNIIETNFIYNTSYEEMKNLYENKNCLYINKQNLNIDNLKNNFKLNTLLSLDMPNQNPYIKVSMERGEAEVLKVKLELKSSGNSFNIEDEFFKGDY